VTDRLAELYDYDELRSEVQATMLLVRPSRTALVLGSTQSLDLLDPERLSDVAVRRRRGGGGLVLLEPDDLWIDWWIPAGDPRWRGDVHASSRMVGQWWADALTGLVDGVVTVHEGALEGDAAYRIACFAGRGPGEVFINDLKAVGVTQWRVREGIFVSTVMHARSTNDVVPYLRVVPEGLPGALVHQVLASLSGVSRESLFASLRHTSGPWHERAIDLRL
jgi:lipoate-protein ligase A